MSNLVVELLLRLIKPAAATGIGIVLLAILVALGEPASPTLGLLCWLCGAAFILLISEGPI